MTDLSACASDATLRIREWTPDEFAASRTAWEALLGASDADALFMSWDWQWRWWTHHSRELSASLHLLAVYSAGGQLLGLAPFYSRTLSVRRVLRTCRLELIGTAWRDPRPTFSDYLDIIVARDHRDAVLAELGAWLRRHRFWQELVVCCTRADSAASHLVRRQLRGACHVREVDELRGWATPIPKQFDVFLAALGSDARRKLFSQRRKLADPVVQQATESEVTAYLELLARYVSQRWARRVVGTPAWSFQLDFAACMARAGRLRLTRLVTRDGPLSVMYIVRTGSTMYYLQSGFDATSTRGVSPGYLHFGYAIEAAGNEGAEYFDFLPGRGRHRDYKQDFAGKEIPVATYHISRGWHRLAYALYGWLSAARERCRLFFRGI